MNARWMSRHPGGPATVELYEAYRDYLEQGRIVVEPIDHLAMGSAYRLVNQPSQTYPGKGTSPLTDGLVAKANYQHQAWVGFEGQPLDLSLNLQEVQTIKSVEMGFLQDHPAGIFLPDKVRVGLSTDGQTYQWFDAEQSFEGDALKKGRHTYNIKSDGVEAKYVRVTTSSPATLPISHLAAGNKLWTFVDEVLIR